MIGAHVWWHFWNHEEWLALLAVSIPATVAAAAAVWSAYLTRANRKTMDTGNDKDLGATVHDIAQLQEIMSAQLHTNTRELLDLRERQIDAAEARVEIDRKLSDHITESNRVHDILLGERDGDP